MKIKSIPHLVSETLNPKNKTIRKLKYRIRKLQQSEINHIQELVVSQDKIDG